MFKRRSTVTSLPQRRPTTQQSFPSLARQDEAVGLLSALRAALPQKRCCSVGIISTLHGEGVSTLAQSLATVAAANPRTKVLLCKIVNQQGDGESPVPFIFMETFTALPSERSSANNVGGFPLAQAARSNTGSELSMGSLNAPSDLQSIVTSVAGSFDLVIVELPPVHDSALGPSLARGLDGVLLVVEAERTRLHAIRAAKKAVESCGGNILGVVLNKRRFHIPDFIYRHL